ncbi:hypothetical protein GmRootV59_52430 (plasmid) [Variovorax sp. V59]|uniref:hypothetical protein n=1 Tax=unclassified Variovorax TaxID=663243 RepID=UPI0034E84628
MLTHLLAFALNRPRVIEAAGEVVSRVAGFVLVAGFIFQALASVMGSLPGAQGAVTAQQFLPGLPTWWVPESAAGVIAWAVVLGLGLSAMFGGRQLRHELEPYR